MKHWRINLIFIIIILFGAVIIGRLFFIQIRQGELYRALAQGQQQSFQLVKGERGQVFFGSGEILAANIKGKYLFIFPAKIEDKEKTSQVLSQILNLDKETVLEKVSRDSFFETIKNNLTEEEEKALENIDLPGVSLAQAFFREYPQSKMACQTIGFFSSQEKGQYGIEGFYDQILQGKESVQEANKGSDIFLTLEYNIQYMAESLLAKAKDNLDIESGQIIVVEPNSGKILALANFPSFDPNYYYEVEDFHIFQNGAMQKLFEPGSVFKPITMAAAIDQGKITPKTIYIDEGSVKIGKDIIVNYNNRVFGEKTMTEVLENSINTGAVFAEQQLGHKLFLQYIDKFGFFQPTGIDLQGEVSSENKEFKKGYDINFATASFGQGIEMTPLQLAAGFCVIANGGKLVKPYIVDKIIGDDGQIIETQPEISSEQIISPDTSLQVTAMLISVVESTFAKAAKLPGYYIAGKTGTAQIPWSSLDIDRRGYSNKTWQSFIGFFPALNPQFLILIKLDNPKAKTAEYSAAPVFKELAKYIIDYYQIPPDYEPR